jgi:hypothetical protein
MDSRIVCTSELRTDTIGEAYPRIAATSIAATGTDFSERTSSRSMIVEPGYSSFGSSTEAELASIVSVERSTVSRDLAWGRRNWQQQYGSSARCDPAVEIGNAIAVFEALEGSTWRQLERVTGDHPRAANARTRCIQTILQVRLARLALLSRRGPFGPSLHSGWTPRSNSERRGIATTLRELQS